MKTRAIHVRRAVAPIDSGSVASLLPVDAEAEAALAKIPMGETIAIKIERRRSNPQNRLYWAIVEYVAEGAGYEDKRILHKGLLVALGYYDAIRLPNGKVLAEVNSTAFDAMDDDEFQVYMDGAIRLICTEVIPGTNSSDLIDEVQLMLGAQPSPSLPQKPAGGLPARSPAVVGPPDSGTSPTGSQPHPIGDPVQASASSPGVYQAETVKTLYGAPTFGSGVSHGEEAGARDPAPSPIMASPTGKAPPSVAAHVPGASLPLGDRPARNLAVKFITRLGVVEWTLSKNAMLAALRTAGPDFALFQQHNAKNIERLRKAAPDLWREWEKESAQIIRELGSS